MRRGQTDIIIAVLITLGILILAGTTGVWTEKKERSAKEEIEAAREKHDTPPLPDEDTYYGSGSFAGAEIYETSVSPLGNAEPGVVQNWSVKVRHEVPVREVAVTVRMDNGFYPVSLELAEGTALDGTWKGSWEVEDTHNIYYQAKIEAKSDTDTSETTITFQALPDDL